jgi:hypothetical protein
MKIRLKSITSVNVNGDITNKMFILMHAYLVTTVVIVVSSQQLIVEGIVKIPILAEKIWIVLVKIIFMMMELMLTV